MKFQCHWGRTPAWVKRLAPLGLGGWAFGLLCYMGWWRTVSAGRIRPRSARRKRWFTVAIGRVERATLGRGSLQRITLSPFQRCPFCHDSLSQDADDVDVVVKHLA